MTQNSLHFSFNNEYVEKYLNFLDTRPILSKEDSGENHHIFPKSIFGKNNIIIRLTYIDHFRAHWYLAKIYETEGMKRQYMQMAKAFFSFIQIADYRKEVIRNFTDEEICELAILIDQSKEHNRLSSIGELNSFYGKHHSPETIQKTLDTKKRNGSMIWTEKHRMNYVKFCKNRNPDDVPRNYYHDPILGINIRLSNNGVKNNLVPFGYVEGRFTSEKESLTRSLSAREFYSTYNGNHWLRGQEHGWYDTKHIYNEETGEQKRIKSTEHLPDGFIYALKFSEKHAANMKLAAFNRRGLPSPWTIITNKNPEKIRKTAEKHRGMKRTSETKSNMKKSKREFFDNGGSSATKGTKRYFNIVTRKFHYTTLDKIEESNNNPELFSGKLYKINNGESFMYITMNEELPLGYRYAPNSGK